MFRPTSGPLPPPPPLAESDALFLDIDGTLLELVSTPSAVAVDAELAALLVRLRACLGGALALVTGRALSNADLLFPGVTLPIAAQHGSERRDADGGLHLHAPDAATLVRLRVLFTEFSARHDGLVLEDKGASLAIHYRNAPQLASHVHRSVRSAVADLPGEGLRLQPGKRLLEVGPAGRDKGTAIRDFLREPPFAGRRPVFVGDDRGDEHGFAIVAARRGVSVKVGPGPTAARFRLPDVTAVRQWLRDLANIDLPEDAC